MAKGQKRSNRETKKPKAKAPSAHVLKQQSQQGQPLAASSLFKKKA
jgi:hypothetical protein